ncbi:hypothetical protein [Parachlamydia acanthamoebae]|nr:hypothetical protein [Parachlamydia acanthamoebae]
MKKFSRILLWGLCLLIAFSAIFMISLPSIVSTEWAKNNFLEDFNKRIHGHLSIDRMQFGWLGSQEISGLKLYDAQGEKVFSIDYISLPTSPIKLLWQRQLDFGVSNLNAKIEWLNPHETNFHEIFDLRSPTSENLKPIATTILENVNASLSTRNREAYATGSIKTGKHSIGQFQFNANLSPELHISADIKNLPVGLLELLIKPEIELQKIIGQTVDLAIKQKSVGETSEIQALFQSKQAEGKIDGVVQDSNFILSAPALITLQSTQELNQFLFEDRFAFNLSDKIQLTINRLNLSFAEPHKAEMEAKVQLPSLKSASENTFQFEDVKLSLSHNFEKETTPYHLEGLMQPSRQGNLLPKLYFTCAGEAYYEKSLTLLIPYHFEGFQSAEKDSPILKLDGTWSSDIHKKKQFTAKGTAYNFPLVYLNLWDLHPALPVVLGPTLNSDFSLTVDDVAKRKGNLQFHAQGSDWQGEGTLVLDDRVKILAPLKGNFVLNPNDFDQLQKLLLPQSTQKYALLQPCTIQFKLNKSAFSLLNGENWQTKLSNSHFDLNFFTTPIQIVNLSSKKQMNFSTLNFDTSSDNLLSEIKFSLNVAEDSQQTALIAKGSAKGIFQDEKINLNAANLDLDVKMQKFSLPLFTKLVASEQLSKKIEALIGAEVSANISAKLENLQGPLNVSISGENGKLSLDGQLENGHLTLSNPLTVQVKATPEFGNEILEDILPPFSQVIKSDEMLQIILDAKGFSLTLSPFDIKSVQIAKGTLVLGKMTFINNGIIRTLLTFLKGNNNPEITAWFTPLYFSMQDGNLKLQRMDMLFAEHYPLALWGNVSIPKDKVDLVVGITKPAINHAFGIEDLSADYVMQIPITGTLDKANVNITQAAGKISALIARNQTNSTSQIVGTLLDVVSGKLNEEKVPPPTTTPFPWEK